MYELPVGLPSELVPLSWLIGVWEGSGILDYTVDGETVTREFGQRISFSHDGLPHLNYSSYTWLEPEAPTTDASGPDSDSVPGPAPAATPLVTETGYWRLSRPQQAGDAGPGLLPGVGPAPFQTAEAVETLRNADGGFDIEVSLVHPGGILELYLGQVKGPRIDLATDAIVQTSGAKPYAAATRLYGLVDSHLLWAWDIAALGQDLRTHASGRLSRASS
ncbi:FABP family protein [Cryobacterium sp. PAMC25264]|uniref:FABP family protein n=1 Tax=Cryobacterium sp. PAMC25264 TaxID=2861288 RepID=UPI001C6374F6|nr:FABP family protein [Cryobacterium sp. PAMC25264]QYF72537.1 FABP family protein [Cryobacterium sp. PAMC25264]